ncbi:MAG: hypothetical protein HY328_03605 [Chloroflexi bacterium]|nr:hypothetical protein [Chloroflexota bacterium]
MNWHWKQNKEYAMGGTAGNQNVVETIDEDIVLFRDTPQFIVGESGDKAQMGA